MTSLVVSITYMRTTDYWRAGESLLEGDSYLVIVIPTDHAHTILKCACSAEIHGEVPTCRCVGAPSVYQSSIELTAPG